MALVVKFLTIRLPRPCPRSWAMERSLQVLYRVLRPLRLLICKRVGMADLLVSRCTNPKEGIRVVADITLMITIDEMVVAEEEGEGDEVVIREAGTIDRHIGKGAATTGNHSPLGDTCGMDEADRGVRREAPDAWIFHGGTNVGEVLLVSTHANLQHLHNQPS